MNGSSIYGIECPECGSQVRNVLESRKANHQVRRRCLCVECGARYTTYELRADEWDALQRRAALHDEGTIHAARLLDMLRDFAASVEARLP